MGFVVIGIGISIVLIVYCAFYHIINVNKANELGRLQKTEKAEMDRLRKNEQDNLRKREANQIEKLKAEIKNLINDFDK